MTKKTYFLEGQVPIYTQYLALFCQNLCTVMDEIDE